MKLLNKYNIYKVNTKYKKTKCYYKNNLSIKFK